MDFDENDDPMDCLKPERLLEEIRGLEGEIRWKPDDSELYFQLGVYSCCLKDNEKAAYSYLKALELDPEMHQAHYLLGEHYFSKKRYWDAAMEFGNYVSAEPDDPDGTLYLKFGIACLRLGRTEDAKRHLEKARLDKDSGRAGRAAKLLSRIS
ncbi:MAG TPA: tetratricopeptide repeat protein [Candidatus Omnitrophota bacterium]|nr:tetratricopeptide repeat protein [Candidatus Omnitrophota bacterium]